MCGIEIGYLGGRGYYKTMFGHTSSFLRMVKIAILYLDNRTLTDSKGLNRVPCVVRISYQLLVVYLCQSRGSADRRAPLLYLLTRFFGEAQSRRISATVRGGRSRMNSSSVGAHSPLPVSLCGERRPLDFHVI